MRIAALDLGTNSFHLLVADVHPDGTFTTVTAEKEMLRLGDVVARHGRIPDAAADRAVATIRRFRQLADAAEAREILAKATSAVRGAANGSELVDRVEAETGVEVDVISGIEEARLIFAAVRASVVIDPGPALCLDLGGGSLEVMVGDRRGLLWAASEHLGVGRLTAEHVTTDPISQRERRTLEEHVRSVLEPVAATVATYAPRNAIGSSGTLTDLARMAAHERTGDIPRSANQLALHRDDFLALHERILDAKSTERRRMPGLEEQRVELVVAGSIVLAVAMELFAFDELTISEWALREGIVLDTVGQHDPDDWSDDPRALRRAAVAGLARRCNSDTAHTRHVARLARSLFDQTEPLHGLADRDRELLGYGVLLHDIGQHVSMKGHHRHAAYLVEHGQLRGFSPHEVALLAALVRHHRRGEPKASEPLYGALDADDRRRIRTLAAILRVADGLDRGRAQLVDGLDVEIGQDLVILRLRAHGDPELELWGARRKRELFEKVFDREVELTVVDAPRRASAEPLKSRDGESP